MPSIFLCSPSMVMGGAERYVLNLAEGLLDDGNYVTIVLMDAKGPLLSEIDHRCQVVSVNKNRAIKSISGLAQIFKNNSPDTIISFQTHMNMIVLIAMIVARKKIPVIVTEHASLSTHINENTPKFTKLKNYIMLMAVKYLYKRAHRLVGVSKGVTQEYMAFVGLQDFKTKTIPSPIVTPKLLLKSQQTPTHQWIVEKDRPIVISMGRLVKVKDHFTLIEAFNKLRKRIDARLIIYGEGAERVKLEELIKERKIGQYVNLPGNEINPFREMAHADLFVQTSISEGFGNVLVEALACGLPVISTDCPVGPREILADGVYGILTPVGDSTALAEAMYKLLNISDSEKKAIISSGKKRANEYSLERTVKSYKEIF